MLHLKNELSRRTISTLIFALAGAMIPFAAVLCSGHHNKIAVYFGFDFWWIYLFNFVGVAGMLAIRLAWLVLAKGGGTVDWLLILCFGLLFAIHLTVPLDPLIMFAWVTIPFGVAAIFFIMMLLYSLARWMINKIRSTVKP